MVYFEDLLVLCFLDEGNREWDHKSFRVFNNAEF
jgi:hypothetical protein